MDCENCTGHKALETDVKTLKNNVIEIFSRLHATERSSDVVNEKLDNIKESQKDIKDNMRALAIKVETIMQAPGQRWNSLVMVIITAIVTAIIAYFIAKMTGR